MRLGICWLVPCALAGAIAPALAQEKSDGEKLELRVVSGVAGRATLDRGRVDGLRAGDRVVLRPRVGLPIGWCVADHTSPLWTSRR